MSADTAVDVTKSGGTAVDASVLDRCLLGEAVRGCPKHAGVVLSIHIVRPESVDRDTQLCSPRTQ